MSRIAVLLVAGCLLLPPVAAQAAPARQLSSRQGDNTIYMQWDAQEGRPTTVTSSRMLRADQKVELLTTLLDRDGEIRMRAVLKNISKKVHFRIDGRLVHKIFDEEGVLVARLRTKEFHRVLGPGAKIVAIFTYTLETGSYSMRTNYKKT